MVVTRAVDRQWSRRDKQIAREAFNKAHDRECMLLAKEMNNLNIREPDELWELHDRLRKRLKTIEQKYDYRYSVLVHVLARLITEGNLSLEELRGMSEGLMEDIRVSVKWYSSG